MTLRAALFPALLLAGTAASASVTVIGGSYARQCYEAAEYSRPSFDQAIAACDMALHGEALVRSDEVATYVNRGILRVRAGRIREGLADFDRAIELDPSLSEAWFNRGAAMLRVDAAAEALPYLDAAVQRGPIRPALAYYGRGLANEAVGNLRAAYEDYRRASELEPGWDRPRADLARFSVRSR